MTKSGGNGDRGSGDTNGKSKADGTLTKSFNTVRIKDIRIKHKYQEPAVHALQTGEPLTLVTGTAGSGKTYMAVWAAMKALQEKKVQKVVLTRPAVEAAGENLGFLPGTEREKLFPYMQPFFHILEELGFQRPQITEMMDKGILEIAPIAFMRGRTFQKAFIICDEAQNATEAQIRLVYSRLGGRSQVAFTGDPTQSDLPVEPGDDNAFEKFAAFLERNSIGQVVRIPPGSPTYRHEYIEKIERAALAEREALEAEHRHGGDPAHNGQPHAGAETSEPA